MPQKGVFTSSITVRNMNHIKHILFCLHFAFLTTFLTTLEDHFIALRTSVFPLTVGIILTVLIKYKNNNQLSQTPRNGSAALNRLTLLNSTHSTSHCHRTVNMGQNVPLQISANYTQTLNYYVTQWDSGKVLSHSWPCSYCFQKIWAF